jgi:hypothetical protein
MALSVVTKRAVVLLALLLIAVAGQPAPLVASPSTEKLKVTVLDTIGRLVTNIPITIEGNGTTRTFLSSEDISHEFELPAGLYQITSQKDAGGYYFPFKRAPFRILSGNTTLINVTPALRILAIGTVLKKKDFIKLAPEPKYQSLVVPHSATPELSLLVQYDHRRDHADAIEYTNHARPFSGVIVSYDKLTICADRVRIAKGSLRVRAEGNVLVEDGKQRAHAKLKVLKFRNGVPVMLDRESQ